MAECLPPVAAAGARLRLMTCRVNKVEAGLRQWTWDNSSVGADYAVLHQRIKDLQAALNDLEMRQASDIAWWKLIQPWRWR